MGTGSDENGEISGVNGEYIEGIANNGLKFQGYIRDGEITNFFPIID